jgi:hypothetical protein
MLDDPLEALITSDDDIWFQCHLIQDLSDEIEENTGERNRGRDCCDP